METDRHTTPARSDEDLLRSFLSGERTALGELANRHERYLLGLASAMLGGRRELACDAVQDMWMRVIRYGASFNGQASLKTWLYRVLLNRCRELAKKGGARPEMASEFADEPREEHEAPVNDASEERTVLRTAVATLGAEKREIILLCYHKSLTHTQAAAVLCIPIGTLKSRLHAALGELRSALSAMEIQQ